MSFWQYLLNLPVLSDRSYGTGLVDVNGRLLVNAGQVNQPVSGTVTANQGAAAAPTNAWPTLTQAAAVGGSTPLRLPNLAATGQAIKTSAGTLYGFNVINGTAATAFVQIFNLAAASVVPGTTVPTLELQVAANAQAQLTLPPMGVAFGTAISAISTTVEGGSVASAAGVVAYALFA